MSNSLQVTAILRLFVVVQDAQAAVDAYQACGVGPWTFQDFSDAAVPEKFVGADATAYQMKLATCEALNVGLAVVEPLDDLSIFAAHLRDHGPGLHHVLVATAEGFEASIVGARILQHGRTATDVRYAYLDQRDPLGLIVEVFGLSAASS